MKEYRRGCVQINEFSDKIIAAGQSAADPQKKGKERGTARNKQTQKLLQDRSEGQKNILAVLVLKDAHLACSTEGETSQILQLN